MNDRAIRINKDEDDFDLKKFLGRFIDQWKLYAICVPAFLILGYLFIRYSTPMFTVHAKVLIQDQQSNSSSSSFMPPSMLSGFSDMFDMPSSVDDELAIFQTLDLMSKVVKDLNLNVSYFTKGNVRNVQLYKNCPFRADFEPVNDSTHATSFDINFKNTDKTDFTVSNSDLSYKEQAKFGQALKTPVGKIAISKTGIISEDETYILSVNSIDATVDAAVKNITTAIPDEKTNMITLDYKTSIPALGQDILKTLISEYMTRNLSEKNQMSDSAIAFISSRIILVSNDLEDVEGNIQQFKQTNNYSRRCLNYRHDCRVPEV